jgi:DNA-binding NarL/FixJ family response regulator
MSNIQPRRPTAVVADDHAATISIVAKLVSRHFDVLASVNDGIRALQAVEELHPDLVVLDVGMPGLDGFETARRIREQALPTRIVFLTIAEDLDYARAASELGGCYVVKRRMHSDLLAAASEALAGRFFLSPI